MTDPINNTPIDEFTEDKMAFHDGFRNECFRECVIYLITRGHTGAAQDLALSAGLCYADIKKGMAP